MDQHEISDEDYSYSDDDCDLNQTQNEYEEFNHEREESSMINAKTTPTTSKARE